MSPREPLAPAADAEKARAANIFDVARLAGVSHQTVSRVLNDLPNVRPGTRQRVEQAIQQLRYRPSPAARALVTRRSRTIGLIATGGPDYGPSSAMLHFNEAARKARYAVSMASMLEADPESLRSAVELLLRQNVEAIVLIAAHRGALDAVRDIELGVPLIAVESGGRGGFHRVGIDQYSGARIAVAHLAELGHTHILHLAGPASSMDALERARGWRDELAARGLLAREPMRGDWSPASGFQHGLDLAGGLLAGEVLAEAGAGDVGAVVGAAVRAGRGPALREPALLEPVRSVPPTAVFAGNDQMALGLIHGLARHGLEVPGDVSVIGFDDIPEAEHFAPPLTTLRQDFDALGRDILQTLLEVLRDEEAPDLPPAVPQLIVRESTAPPRW